MGGEVNITEWFETSPHGEPYTASIVASINSFDGAVPSKEMLEDTLRSIKSAKSARTLFTFSQAANVSGGVGIVGACQPVSYVRLIGEC